MDNEILYYVDSIKHQKREDVFVARLLSQESYSYKAQELYVTVLPELIDEQILYEDKGQDETYRNSEARRYGIKDGTFIRLLKKPNQIKTTIIRQNDIYLYSSTEQITALPELKKQKYKNKEQNINFKFSLTEPFIAQQPQLYCFNVGQGDMSLFISSSGHAYIIDTYITAYKKQEILKTLKKLLNNRPIEAIILTHRHFDHYYGAHTLLQDNSFKVKSLIVNKSFLSKTNPNQVDKLLNLAQQKGCEILSQQEVQSIDDGNTQLFFKFYEGRLKENDNSILLQIYYQDKLYYMTGDMGYQTLENEKLEKKYREFVLKVSHHGSNTGTSFTFLRKLIKHASCGLDDTPKNNKAFISVGRVNRYKHPDNECLIDLMKAHITTTFSFNTKIYSNF